MKKKQKKSKFSIVLIVIDIFVLVCFFVAYGPFLFFRDFLVTTAMTTMTHKYFAYVLYSESLGEEILDNNKVIEIAIPRVKVYTTLFLYSFFSIFMEN